MCPVLTSSFRLKSRQCVPVLHDWVTGYPKTWWLQATAALSADTRLHRELRRGSAGWLFCGMQHLCLQPVSQWMGCATAGFTLTLGALAWTTRRRGSAEACDQSTYMWLPARWLIRKLRDGRRIPDPVPQRTKLGLMSPGLGSLIVWIPLYTADR